MGQNQHSFNLLGNNPRSPPVLTFRSLGAEHRCAATPRCAGMCSMFNTVTFRPVGPRDSNILHI